MMKKHTVNLWLCNNVTICLNCCLREILPTGVYIFDKVSSDDSQTKLNNAKRL